MRLRSTKTVQRVKYGAKYGTKHGVNRLLAGLGQGAAMLAAMLMLTGCEMIVMKPAGDIAGQQADLIRVSTFLMLLIIVPVIVLSLFFAWKYRASNTKAEYSPEWDHSAKLELVIWGAPLLIIIVLGLVTWVSTHKLDPYRPLDRISVDRPLPKDHKVLFVEVVALDWKWLFIYPNEGIATVNELVVPVDVPVRFKITSSTVMNSFYIPALAGQIYAMPGMQTTLNAVMNKVGQYEGFSANYSGSGFSHMRFQFHGKSQADFDQWVAKTRNMPTTLDRTAYLQLEEPSSKEPVQRFASVTPNLFHAIVNRCVEPGSVCMDLQMAMDMQRNGKPGEGSLAFLIDQMMCRTVRLDNTPSTLQSASTRNDPVSF